MFNHYLKKKKIVNMIILKTESLVNYIVLKPLGSAKWSL